MIFDLYYISCTYVKPMNWLVLGNIQYYKATRVFQYSIFTSIFYQKMMPTSNVFTSACNTCKCPRISRNML